MSKIFLTAKSHNGRNFAKPRVIQVESQLLRVIGQGTDGLTKIYEIREDGSKETYVVYESGAEISAAELRSATDIQSKLHVALELEAAGANAGAALDITKYLSEVDTVVATSADGVQLDAATKNKVRVLLNTSAVAIELWPQTGENFDGSADDAAIAHAAGKRVHYVCLEAGTWVKADDFTQK